MRPVFLGTILLTFGCLTASSETSEPRPRFEIAGVQASKATVNVGFRSYPVREGRYEVKTATMVDLIRLAYGFDADKILGGPSWLEMNRFDVVAKVPAGSTPESHKLMLQSLLEERFQLVLHKDTKPVPAYVLLPGKKPQLKEADGTEESGCKMPSASSAPSGEGTIRMFVSSPTGATSSFNLGPGMTVQYQCRNMTMAAFAAGLRGMMGANLGTNPVLDQTGIEGKWNFDVKWSVQIMGPAALGNADRISTVDAVDKQLGLKLEERPIPTPVIVVDRVNAKPTENPPGLAEALPPLPVPTEFEVASVKQTEPVQPMRSQFQLQPGGRVNIQGMPMQFIVSRAFNTSNSELLTGLPKWAESDRYDINAKATSEGPASAPLDPEGIAPMLKALLVDRFKMKYHTEDRQLQAYSLVAGKPKMKKADPASRTYCRNNNAAAGAPPGSRMITCQNITMAQFAERLQNVGPGLSLPVLDATGLEGTWDFTLVFSQAVAAMRMAERGAALPTGVVPASPAGPAADGAASDPSGGYTIFEAIEKQLGLKLEMRKRTVSVIVIDSIEQKPSEN